MKRIVVTGLGPVSSIGVGIDNFLASLKNGSSGLADISLFDASNYPRKQAYEVKIPDNILPPKAKKLDRFSQFALIGTYLAIQDAELKTKDAIVRLGVGVGGLGSISESARIMREEGIEKVPARTIPNVIANAGPSNVSIAYQLAGEAVSVNAACASGLIALMDACDKIRLGYTEVAVTGGVEAAVVDTSLISFYRMGILSSSTIKPYDINRDGFILGEGAGILVLEELEHAKKRHAKIYAEVLGYGSFSDMEFLRPTGEALERAISSAILTSGNPEIDYVSGHGTATKLNDVLESKTLNKLLPNIPVSSLKPMTGHCMAASSGLELLASSLMLKHNFVHPTINFETPDPECLLDCVPNHARELSLTHIVKISSGFGGHNCAVVLRSYNSL